LGTIRAEKFCNEYRVFLPGYEKTVLNLKDLEELLTANGVPKDKYPPFESDLLSKGDASVTVNYSGRQVTQY
jgi:hypothetical protein